MILIDKWFWAINITANSPTNENEEIDLTAFSQGMNVIKGNKHYTLSWHNWFIIQIDDVVRL